VAALRRNSALSIATKQRTKVLLPYRNDNRGPTRQYEKSGLGLGHADVRTTEIHLRLDPSEKLEPVEAVLPPAMRHGQFKAPDALIASLLDLGTPVRLASLCRSVP